MPNYNVIATKCPAIQVPGAMLVPGSSSPTTGADIAAGVTTGLVAAFNENAVRLDSVGRYGGGFYGVAEGLELTAGSGLTLNVSAGTFCGDGIVYKAAFSQVLTDAVYSWLFLSREGALSVTTAGTDTPPAWPLGAIVFLGRVITAGGVITDIDYSGRPVIRAMPMRRTGDVGVPGDTPAAGLRFFSQSNSGLYFWTGASWIATGGGAGFVPHYIPVGSTVYVPQYYQMVVKGPLTVLGTLEVKGELWVT